MDLFSEAFGAFEIWYRLCNLLGGGFELECKWINNQLT